MPCDGTAKASIPAMALAAGHLIFMQNHHERI